MKKQTILISGILSIIIFTGAVTLLVNPLLRSNEGIRRYMLKSTPIGMSMEDVVRIIGDNTNWRITETNDTGYTLINGIPSFFPRNLPSSTGTIVGEKSLRVYIGDYRIFFITSVEVYYGFDAELKLIDITVKKDKDTW